ncbi:unnamed protein product [Rotaria magnacalcarata]|uniref:Coiled-coil domain-containing protein 132 n=2 Tax=Rotaria magnacalcarata TaxID=392030 RepID=A0A819SH30_9BILA|nr:unnamed protein product [Rotaria magnacalcarata]CAF4101649.1 unnamed protein product [Rotaria magnacalcarata]
MFDSFKDQGFLSISEKADRETLSTIENNYYIEDDFDAKEYELQKLLSSQAGNPFLNLSDVTTRRDCLANQLEVVTKRVSKLILENSSSYTAELQRVTVLTSALEGSIETCHRARRLGENFTKEKHIEFYCLIRNAMRKQQWINVLRNIEKLKKLHSIDQELKEMVKHEDFVGAIQLCRQCGNTVLHYKEYTCIGDLSTKLQDTLDFIEESIDVTLAKLCLNFNPHTYQRLLNAYRVLGKSLTFMDQLQMHFVNVVQTRTLDILLKTVGTHNDQNLSSYIDLSKIIPEESFYSCLHELNVCFWQIIKSYKLIWLWHEKNPASIEATQGDRPEPSQEFLIQKLEGGSSRLWHEIQQKMKTFILENNMTTFKFEAFIQVLKVINRLMEIGEQFCQSDSSILQEAMRRQSVVYFRSYHNGRLDELKMFLENETWQRCPVKSTFHITQLHEFRFLRETPSFGSDLATSTSFNQKSDLDLFDRYLYTEREHPFDLDQTQAGLSSSPSQYSETNSLEADDVNMTNGNAYYERKSRSHSNSSTGSDIEHDHDEQKQSSTLHNHSRYHDEKNAPTIVTNTTLNVTRLFGRYMEMIEILKPIAFDVIICMTQLFDYYLYTVYTLFACDMNEIPADALSSRLRFTIKRINDNLIASNDSEAARHEKIAAAHLSPLVDLNGPRSILYGLPPRIVAAESLVFLAEQFDFLLPYLKLMIPSDRHTFLTQFYSQTIQVTHELRIPIYHNVSANILDYMSIALMISKVNWDIGEILTQHNVYVDKLSNELQTFRNQFDHINEQLLPVPKAVYRTIWDQILDKIFYTMVEGYASAKKCSNEGRALMQLDFQQLLRRLERIIADLKPLPHKEFVENYIKAYYLPEQSIDQWVRDNTMYTIKQRMTLVTMMSHLSRKKRAQLTQYLDEQDRSRTPVLTS